MPHPSDPLLLPLPILITLSHPLDSATTPSSAWSLGHDAHTLGLCLVALLCAGFFQTLRDALRGSLPARVLAHAKTKARIPNDHARLTTLLGRADLLAESASLLKLVADGAFIALLLSWFNGPRPLAWPVVATTLAVAAPTMLLFTLTLPHSMARARGDRLLVTCLPLFARLQWPIGLLIKLHNTLRGAIQRSLHLPVETPEERLLVEGLRGLAQGAVDKGELEDEELELVLNVMEFGDVDAAEVMTPRTEIHAIDSQASLEQAAATFTEVGHSRLPVFEDRIDNIIGTLRVLDVLEALSVSPTLALTDLMRPALLVPETKLVSTLLEEFRAGKNKMAIVLDEYGGTAGVVTLMDVLEEIVGDIQDEGEEAGPNIRELEAGTFEVQATLHVSEVNEELGLDLDEDSDFETLAGFVLAELGHFPESGEQFQHNGVRYGVAEATDRRVLLVHVTPEFASTP